MDDKTTNVEDTVELSVDEELELVLKQLGEAGIEEPTKDGVEKETPLDLDLLQDNDDSNEEDTKTLNLDNVDEKVFVATTNKIYGTNYKTLKDILDATDKVQLDDKTTVDAKKIIANETDKVNLEKRQKEIANQEKEVIKQYENIAINQFSSKYDLKPEETKKYLNKIKREYGVEINPKNTQNLKQIDKLFGVVLDTKPKGTAKNISTTIKNQSNNVPVEDRINEVKLFRDHMNGEKEAIKVAYQGGAITREEAEKELESIDKRVRQALKGLK